MHGKLLQATATGLPGCGCDGHKLAALHLTYIRGRLAGCMLLRRVHATTSRMSGLPL